MAIPIILTPAELRRQSYELAATIGLSTGNASPQALFMFYLGMDIQLCLDNNDTVRYDQLLYFAQSNLTEWVESTNSNW